VRHDGTIRNEGAAIGDLPPNAQEE